MGTNTCSVLVLVYLSNSIISAYLYKLRLRIKIISPNSKWFKEVLVLCSLRSAVAAFPTHSLTHSLTHSPTRSPCSVCDDDLVLRALLSSSPYLLRAKTSHQLSCISPHNPSDYWSHWNGTNLLLVLHLRQSRVWAGLLLHVLLLMNYFIHLWWSLAASSQAYLETSFMGKLCEHGPPIFLTKWVEFK